MKQIAQNEMENVTGGIAILWGPAWTAVSAAFVATDASQNASSGFNDGFKQRASELRQLNGWD
ncbi:hypothetical protein ACFO4O_00680 [Glaciecola siphonariae]|uniref:Bacteriocin n=1 Tax=Glaciecola siphonariae TaxID=521012 RepID=A0ABV9LT40_9ALTE